MQQPVFLNLRRVRWQPAEFDLSEIRRLHFFPQAHFQSYDVFVSGDVDRPSTVRKRSSLGIGGGYHEVPVGARQDAPGLLYIVKNGHPGWGSHFNYPAMVSL